MSGTRYTDDYETWARFQKELGNENPSLSDFTKVLELIRKVETIERNGLAVEPIGKLNQKDFEKHLSQHPDNTIDSYILQSRH